MKTFNIQSSIGKARYVINYHNGTDTHQDGSPFFNIKILSNKREVKGFTNKLRSQGYEQH